MTHDFGGIAFMQGRTVPQVEGHIQRFPKASWVEDAKNGRQIGFSLIEWTLDLEDFFDNPLIAARCHNLVNSNITDIGLTITAVTCDFFMQTDVAWWEGTQDTEILGTAHWDALFRAMSIFGIPYAVVPLVDSRSLKTVQSRDTVADYFQSLRQMLDRYRVEILFELDLTPIDQLLFVESLRSQRFGINFDIGNSAGEGFDPESELDVIGHLVRHVHVKDRLLGGGTVPLGTGSADIPRALQKLSSMNYKGNFTIQGARASDEDHIKTLSEYLSYVRSAIPGGVL